MKGSITYQAYLAFYQLLHNTLNLSGNLYNSKVLSTSGLRNEQDREADKEVSDKGPIPGRSFRLVGQPKVLSLKPMTDIFRRGCSLFSAIF